MRLEAPLKEMTAAPVPAVEADAVGRLQPPDAAAQVGLRRLDQQMIVIGHQAEAMEPQAKLFERLDQGVEKAFAVFVVAENLAAFVAAFVAAGRDVVDGARVFDANGTGHAPEFVPRSRPRVKFQELTPCQAPPAPVAASANSKSAADAKTDSSS
jgi:hypothetical protein